MTSCENQQYPGWRWHHLISKAGRRNTEMDYRRWPTRQQTNAPKFMKRKNCCIYTLSSLKSQRDPSRWHFCDSFKSSLRLNVFEISNTLTSPKNSSFSLASAEASLYRREAVEREKEDTRGTMGREKRRSEVFSSSHRPPRAFYFSIIAIFIGIPSGSLCGEERFILSCKSFKFCF